MSQNIRITFLKAYRYRSALMLPGESCDVPRQDAKLLIAIRKAEECSSVEPDVTVNEPAPAVVEIPSVDAEAPRRRAYRRRDMTSEPPAAA